MRYGARSIKEFCENYTLKQVIILLDAIEDSKYKELSTQATLHGRKMKPRNKSVGLSKEERAEVDERAESVFDRMKREHDQRNGKDGIE